MNKKVITLILASLALTQIMLYAEVPFIIFLVAHFILGFNWNTIYTKLGLEKNDGPN